jgi:hypothetical protein
MPTHRTKDTGLKPLEAQLALFEKIYPDFSHYLGSTANYMPTVGVVPGDTIGALLPVLSPASSPADALCSSLERIKATIEDLISLSGRTPSELQSAAASVESLVKVVEVRLCLSSGGLGSP